jgi:uncharacterized protein (DUF111 family)
MVAAGEKLGCAKIDISQTEDEAFQLTIDLNSKNSHLGGNRAKTILNELFSQFNIKEPYRIFGQKILDILIQAETRAHKEFDIFLSHHHSSHTHTHDESVFLHEAQDIIIDIMGAVMGMQVLEIEPEATLLSPISVGGGFVDCSHGRLSIPAPATSIIIDQYQLDWEKGPVEKELFTPTGAAILAALDSKSSYSTNLKEFDVMAIGTSRGSKILDIPPLKIYITR